MEAFWTLIALVATTALVVVVVLYARELRRIDEFLRERDPGSNARLRTEISLPGIRPLLVAVNHQLDREAQTLRGQRAAKQVFEQNMMCLSHDVRTPLAGAKGYMQLAGNESDALVRGEYLVLAETRLDNAQTLLDQLLFYTQSVSPPRGEKEELNVIPLLEATLLANYGAFEEAGLEVEISLGAEPLMAVVEESAMRRIFENIIANALNHGTRSFMVTRQGNKLEFSNRLREEEHPDADLVFVQFYRADAARTRPGAGLGLAIVKNLAQSMGITSAAVITEDTFTLSLEFVEK